MNDSSVVASDRTGRRSVLWIVLVFAILAFLRIAAHSDIHEGDQPKQADYVLDIVCNGNWTVQHHADGSIMSKPPLYNWLAAPVVLLFGAEDVFLKMPSLLAGLAAALLTWDLARRRLGERAALLGSLFLMLTSMFTKQMYYARTDMLLTCFIVLQFWAIVRWEEESNGSLASVSSWRSGWLWIFWGAAALGNLTKGPLALLPHFALSAYWLWEGRFKERYARLGVRWGLPLALAPLLIWFAFAYRAEGYAVYEHMVKAEVVARFQSDADRAGLKGTDRSNRNFFYYIPHVLSRTLPWSLFALIGLWGVFTAKKNTELSDRQRSMLYFLAAWFFTTLLFFSIVPSKRADRIFPAIPAFCLLAGWAFEGGLRWMERRVVPRMDVRLASWIAAFIGAVFLLAGMGLMGFETGADFEPFSWMHRKISPAMLDQLSSFPALGLVTGACVLIGGALVLISFVNKLTRPLAFALIATTLALVAFYQVALGSWVQTDFCEGAPQVCRAVRTLAKAEGTPVLIIAGSGPGARFYLLQAGLETTPTEAAARLARPHPAMIVVGTQASFDGKQRKGGGLDEAGLSGAQAITVEGVLTFNASTDKLPTVKWLGAVWIPERK